MQCFKMNKCKQLYNKKTKNRPMIYYFICFNFFPVPLRLCILTYSNIGRDSVTTNPPLFQIEHEASPSSISARVGLDYSYNSWPLALRIDGVSYFFRLSNEFICGDVQKQKLIKMNFRRNSWCLVILCYSWTLIMLHWLSVKIALFSHLRSAIASVGIVVQQ